MKEDPTVFPLPAGDADEEKRAERQAGMVAAALAGTSPEERSRLPRIVDFLPCYVALVSQDHRIHFHNRTFEEFFGPVDNRPCYAVLRDREEPCAYCAALDAAADDSACVSEWNHHKTRHSFRVYAYPFEEADGSRLALKVGFNITSANRVQQALDLSEQSYRVITDNLSIGVALLSTDLRVRAGNPPHLLVRAQDGSDGAGLRRVALSHLFGGIVPRGRLLRELSLPDGGAGQDCRGK